MVKDRRPPPPLDAAALDRLALRYVERFATTRGRLTDYLARKIRERGWAGEAVDPAIVADRMAARGYVDDQSWAEAKAAALTRRGLGGARVTQALRQARVAAPDAEAARAGADAAAVESALAFARRRRIGPFARAVADRPQREKQIAAMIRAGHSFALARIIAAAAPGEMPQIDTDTAGPSCDADDPW